MRSLMHCLCIPLLLVSVSCSGGGGGDQGSDEELCEVAAEVGGVCCGLDSQDIAIAKASCDGRTLSSFERTTAECAIEANCADLLAGQVCGGITCLGTDPPTDQELCEDLTDIAGGCCGFSSGTIADLKLECVGRVFTEAETSAAECSLTTSCSDLFDGACGGLTCST